MANFRFTNRFGMPHNPAAVNRAIMDYTLSGNIIEFYSKATGDLKGSDYELVKVVAYPIHYLKEK